MKEKCSTKDELDKLIKSENPSARASEQGYGLDK